MPVKSHSEDHDQNTPGAHDRVSNDAKKLQKREIKMPDGRYMIFYSEAPPASEEESR